MIAWPIVAGPLVGLALILAGKAGVAVAGLQGPALGMLGITLWVALWWVTEALPIAATSLLPALLLPVAGVLGSEETAGAYMDRFILLMMAGFMAALAIERCGLHRRLALAVLLRVGTSPRRLILGMLVATALASMWIANTAATLIMLPVALALVARLERTQQVAGFAGAICIAIAWGASIGGIATPLGTPPNLIYLSAVEKLDGRVPGFFDWMSVALPISILMVVVAFLLLRQGIPRHAGDAAAARDVLQGEWRALGLTSRDERAVALIFGAMVLLWVTRKIDLGVAADGSLVSLGWAPLLGLGKLVDDSTVAVLGVLLLFLWPSSARAGERLLDWPTASRIPWEVILLFGGGLALAKGFQASGLSAELAGSLGALRDADPWLIMLTICLLVTFITEVTSNTAITTLMMPVLASFSLATGLPPEWTMLPAAISASCAFMLPVATPPNAVVYGTGHVNIGRMARAGFWLNLAGVLIVSGVIGAFGR
ncbi:MAG: SLC13/DASS family transporter [Rhodocyclaceae bacterium]|nr:SLC13/DASS family transporter [Rhodocyclaceae bacterium]